MTGDPTIPREIIGDDRQHTAGEREVVDWDRPDGRYFDVPLVYLREVTAEDYLRAHPAMRGRVALRRCYFWEVSVD